MTALNTAIKRLLIGGISLSLLGFSVLLAYSYNLMAVPVFFAATVLSGLSWPGFGWHRVLYALSVCFMSLGAIVAASADGLGTLAVGWFVLATLSGVAGLALRRRKSRARRAA